MARFDDLSAVEQRVTVALGKFGIQIGDSAWDAVIGALNKPGNHTRKAWVYDKDGNGTVHLEAEANAMKGTGEYFDTPTGGQKDSGPTAEDLVEAKKAVTSDVEKVSNEEFEEENKADEAASKKKAPVKKKASKKKK